MKHSLRGPNGRFVKSDHPSLKKPFMTKQDLYMINKDLKEELYAKEQKINVLNRKLEASNTLNFVCVGACLVVVLFLSFFKFW